MSSWSSVKIDKTLLLALVEKMRDRVRYKLGAKAPQLDCDSSEITRIDCSGFVRYILYRASNGVVRIPDGSWNQHEWVSHNGFKLVRYKDVAYLKDGRLRIAFLNADGGIGHVWLVLGGQTIESRGGKGVDRRPWNTPVLAKNVDACYVLTLEPME